MKNSAIVLAVVAFLGSAATAHADSVSFSSSVPLTSTNWNNTLGLGLFDTNLGTLTSIDFGLSGTVSGTGRVESEDAAASVVNVQLGSTLTLMRPDTSTLVVTNPLFSQNFNFTAWDNNTDFGGTSGGTTGLVSNTGSNSFNSVLATDFSLFSQAGGGSINLILGAGATSSASGNGNLVASLSTKASGIATVTYNYIATPVPEPETYAMMLSGIGLLAFVRRRQPKKTA